MPAPAEPQHVLFPETKVGGFSRVDGTIEFYTRINALLAPGMVLLDFGAGRGAASEDPIDYRRALCSFKGKVARVIGVDVDDAVLGNPLLDAALVVRPDQRLPLDDASIDIVVSDSTLEHVDDPGFVVAELGRVLKPGGWLCARTPNRWGYVALAARLIPEKLHAAVLRRAQPSRKHEDVFPTRYRLNSWHDLRRHLPDRHWNLTLYTLNAEPLYVGNSTVLWRLMLLVFRLLPEHFGTTFFVFAQKREQGRGSHAQPPRG